MAHWGKLCHLVVLLAVVLHTAQVSSLDCSMQVREGRRGVGASSSSAKKPNADSCARSCRDNYNCLACDWHKSSKMCRSYTEADVFVMFGGSAGDLYVGTQAAQGVDHYFKPNCFIKTVDGEACASSYVYKGRTFYTCTFMDAQASWCSLTPNYGTGEKWGYCRLETNKNKVNAGAMANTGADGCTMVASADRQAFGGNPRAGISTAAACSQACLDDATCYYADFDKQANVCYINTLTNPRIEPNACCTSFKKDCSACADTFTETANTASYGANGPQAGVTTQAGCQSACLALPIAQCGSYDFFTASTECWINTDTSPQTRSETGSSHYSRTACDQSTTESSAVTVPTAATPCQVTEYENQMYAGGTEVASAKTKVDCALYCQQDANCKVASFNAASLQCLVLNTASARTAVSGVYAFERTCKTCVDSFTEEQGKGYFNGKQQLGVSNGMCKSYCLALINCNKYAIDTTQQPNEMCFIYYDTNGQGPYDWTTSTTYTKVPCGDTVTSTTGCTDTFDTTADKASYGASLYPAATTKADCQAQCLRLDFATCGSYDFFAATSECWINPSDAPTTYDSAGSNHYARKACDATTTSAQTTQAATQPATSAATAPVGTTIAPVGSTATTCTMVEENNALYSGGTEMTGRTEAQCREECLADSTCVASDYNTKLGACYIHTTLTTKLTSTDYKLWTKNCGDCKDTFTMTTKKAASGGQLSTGVNTPAACEAECLKVPLAGCGSFDFFDGSLECWINPLNSPTTYDRADSTNYIRVPCAQPTVATVTSSGCTDTWTTQPNIGAYDGILQNGILKLDTCLQRCLENPACKSIDFVSLISTNDRCFVIIVDNPPTYVSTASGEVTHYIRVPCQQQTETTTGTSLTGCTMSTLVGKHGFGGQEVVGVTDGASCQSTCLSDPSCTSSDFDKNENKCYKYTKSLSEIMEADDSCCDRYTKSCDGPSGCTMQMTSNMHGFGGIEQTGAGTPAACQTLCLNNAGCTSMDYNKIDNQCFTYATAVDQILTATDTCCDRYIKSCPGTTTSSTTSVPVVTTTKRVTTPTGTASVTTAHPTTQTVTAATTTAATTARIETTTITTTKPPTTTTTRTTTLATSTTTKTPTPPVPLFSGRCSLTTLENTQGSGGISVGVYATVEACRYYCLGDETCLQAEYDKTTKVCYKWMSSGGTLTPGRSCCTHFTKECKYCSVKVIPDSYTNGGLWRQNIHDKHECYRLCLYDSTCLKSDYHLVDNNCWHFFTPNQEVLGNQKCCVIHEKVCKGCQDTYTETSGFRANGGKGVSGVNSVEDCKNYCTQLAACTAIDYAPTNPDYKCFWFDSSVNPFIGDSNVNHYAKKDCAATTTVSTTLSSTTSRPIECQADIVFVLDSSGSIVEMTGATDLWDQVKAFLTNLVNSWHVNPNLMRVSMVQFSDEAKLLWDLNRYKDDVSVLDAIAKLRLIGGETDTVEALELLREDVFKESAGHRAGVKKIAILLTDGRTDDDKKQAVQTESEKVKDAGIHVIGVGVGPQGTIDVQQLRMIVSEPYDKNYFSLNDYPSVIGNIDNLLRDATGCKPRNKQP